MLGAQQVLLVEEQRLLFREDARPDPAPISSTRLCSFNSSSSVCLATM
jgi:hypothetical protein